MSETKQKKVIRYGIEDDWLGVHAISLVDMPAIEIDFVALRKDLKPLDKQLVKLREESERRMVYGPILVPEKEILRIDDEGNEYYIVFPKETIVKAVQLLMKKNQHHNATVDHAFAVSGCTVVEMWIKEDGSDKSTFLGIDAPIGSAFVGMLIENDEVWSEVKAGNVKGFSVEAFFSEIGADMMEAQSVEQIIRDIENLEP
jgi:sulfur transfer protein SufE